MKQLIFGVLAALSMSAFSQSYFIFDNGLVVTTDKGGFTYDLGHYAFPQKITLKGGRYFVEEGTIISTIDENGVLFRKYEVMPEKIIGKGSNYFMSSKGELYTVDTRGVLTVTEHPELASATSFGGTFFFVPLDEEKTMVDLVVVNQEGKQGQGLAESIKLSEIVAIGGTYFMNNRGIVHTVSLIGEVRASPEVRVGVIMKKGGNYFVDSSGTLFTVAEDGNLRAPLIPLGLRTSTVTKLGSNYFLDLSGRLFIVDHNGDVYERTMRDHDFRHVRVISL